MTPWEYRAIEIKPITDGYTAFGIGGSPMTVGTDGLDEILMALGMDGWELVMRWESQFIFKRPMQGV